MQNGNSKIIPVRLFAFVSQRKPTKEAISAIRETIEENADFRRVVASYASPSSVGEAGYLWLGREPGWQQRFEELTGKPVLESVAQLSTLYVEQAGGINVTNGDELNEQQPPQPPGGFEIDAEETQLSSVTGSRDLSDELSSLRGLVDRLADERTSVADAVEGGKISASAAAEVEALKTEVDALRSELNRLENAPRESKQLSDALNRQVKLERELSDLRDIRSELESKLSEAEVALRDNKDRLSRASESQSAAETKLNRSIVTVEELEVSNANLREDLEALRIERDDVAGQIAEINRVTGGVDVATLQADNTALAERAFTAESELSRLRATAARLENELKESRGSNSALQTEKAEAAVRLSEAESLLETTQSSLNTYKSQAESSAVEVEDFKAQIEEFNEQVGELQGSLAEALEDLAKVRAEGDEDRASFRKMRAERDSLLARVAEVEQADQEKSRTIEGLQEEREKLSSKQDELVTERGKLKGETAAAQRENDQLSNRLQLLQDKIEPLEVAMLAEKHKVEELSAQLDAANDDRARIEADIASLKISQAKNDVEQPGFGDDELASLENSTPQLDALASKIEQSRASQDRHPAAQAEQSFEPSAQGASSAEGQAAGVWADDWSEDLDEAIDFSDFDSPAPSIKVPAVETASGEVDIDEISELLSRTVTDFKALGDIEEDINTPPSVFDSTTKSWEEDPVMSSDPLESMRQLVSSDSAVLVVDGDAVAAMGWARMSVAEQRASLVTFLAHITEEFGTTAEVVFNSRVAGPGALPLNDTVRIRMCQPPTEMGTMISEVVTSLPPAWPCAVVSDDAAILAAVANNGVTSYTNENLLDFISMIAAN